MKVAVINFSGNVGKTTVAACLLQPRIPGAPIISVESLNADAGADGLSVERLQGRKFAELQDRMMDLPAAIVDIGASNVEEFIKLMQQFSGSHDEFDLFLVPTVKEKKQQSDTVNTIRALAKIGIPQAKIRLIFNKLENNDTVAEEFPSLVGLAKMESSCIADPDAVIYSNEVYERLKDVRKPLAEITNDPVDYRAKLNTLTDPDERKECGRMVALKRLAITANRNLDATFAAVTSTKLPSPVVPA